MNKAEQFLQRKLNERQQSGNYRQLKPESALIDFCSNDYLGFAHSNILKQLIEEKLNRYPGYPNGSGGSRLLAGNLNYTETFEAEIAAYHGYGAGLIYNSGYDANLGLFSALGQRGDTIITDELAHASIIDGARLSYANRYSFRHNDLYSLKEKLQHAKGNIYVAVESIYSMDGDTAPLTEIARLVQEYDAHLIVDEAHATGVFGKGIVDQLGLQEQVFAQVVTFGKALGCHGAIVLGSNLLRNYLINFSRSFIYTTAAPFHHLTAVNMAYALLQRSDAECIKLKYHIDAFKGGFNSKYQLIASNSAIQCIVLGSNEKAKQLAELLQQNGYDVRPILSPTVAAGAERLRICLHTFNSEEDINGLLDIINQFK